MEKIKKYKYMAIASLVLLILSILILGTELYLNNINNDFLVVQKEKRLNLANYEMNNLVSLMIGKVSKQDIIKYYRTIGVTISEEKDDILYFESLGYEFNEDEKLVKIFPRIIGFDQYMPNPIIK